MTSMDKQNRISITENIRKIIQLDFSKEIRLYIRHKQGTPFIILSNDANLELPCFGIIHIDPKFRFFLPKEVRTYMEITPQSKLLIYSFQGELTIKKLY